VQLFFKPSFPPLKWCNGRGLNSEWARYALEKTRMFEFERDLYEAKNIEIFVQNCLDFV
jgi:hypothetical protein